MCAELREKRLGLCGQFCERDTALGRLRGVRGLEGGQSGIEIIGGVE